MAKSPYATRKPRFRNKRASQHAALVGQIVWASNTLHATFSAIFTALLRSISPDEPYKGGDVAGEIWHALRSDDLQRTVLLAAAHSILEDRRRDIKSLAWALQMAGRLSEYRNDAVHTPFTMVLSSWRPWAGWEPSPDSAGHPHRVAKLHRVGPAKLFRHVIGDLTQLDGYAVAILDRIYAGKPLPLPKRPLLRSIQLVRQSPPQSNKRRRLKAKRRLQLEA